MPKILTLLICGILAQNTYANLTKVVDVDRDAHIVTCEDYNGNLWQFDEEDEWHEGDLCNLVLYTNNTDEVYDDVIVGTYYERIGNWIEDSKAMPDCYIKWESYEITGATMTRKGC